MYYIKKQRIRKRQVVRTNSGDGTVWRLFVTVMDILSDGIKEKDGRYCSPIISYILRIRRRVTREGVPVARKVPMRAWIHHEF